jgi:hypothetical protein
MMAHMVVARIDYDRTPHTDPRRGGDAAQRASTARHA